HGLYDDAVVVGQSPFPGPACANEIALDQVGARSRARDQETRSGIAGNQIAGGRRSAADGVVAGAALDIAAVHVGGGGGAGGVAGNGIAGRGGSAADRVVGGAVLNHHAVGVGTAGAAVGQGADKIPFDRVAGGVSIGDQDTCAGGVAGDDVGGGGCRATDGVIRSATGDGDTGAVGQGCSSNCISSDEIPEDLISAAFIDL